LCERELVGGGLICRLSRLDHVFDFVDLPATP